MADDPIGTVRREDFESGHSIWVRLDADATPGNEWSCVWSTYWSNIGCTRSPAAVADDLVIGAVPGTPAAAGLLAAPAAQPAPFTDLTARLAAADAGWGLASGDGPSNPDYIRFLAAQVEAFEGVASPAAPADDEATAEREKRVDQLADRIAMDAFAAWCRMSNRDAYVDQFLRTTARNAALAALREGQQ